MANGLERLAVRLGLELRRQEAVAAPEPGALHDDESLHRFVEHAPIAIALFDRDMRYLAASRRYAEDYGVDVRGLVGRRYDDVFPELPPRWREVHARCLAGAIERSDGEPFSRADGRVDWVRWELRPWRDATGAIGGVVLFSDLLTEQHETLLSLKRSEARLRALFDQAVIGIARVDPESGRFLQVNDASCRILGRPREGLVGQSWTDITHPDDVEGNQREVARLSAGELPSLTLEERFIREGGETIWARITATRVALPEGGASLLVTFEDITDRRRAEDALRERERRLAAIFRNSLSAMVVTRRSDKRILEVSDSFESMFGWSRAECLGRSSLDLGLWVAPAERDAAYARISKDLAPTEMLGRRKSGEEGWFLFSAGAIEVDGEACVIAQIHDVTALHRADAALRESERHLRALFDLAPVGILELDPIDGRLLAVNARMCAVTGRSADELVALGIDDLAHPEERAALRADFERLARGEVETLQGERCLLRADGTPIWVSLTARAAGTPAGPARALAAVEDISRVRRDDAALRLYKTAIDAAANAVVITDARAIIQVVNPAFTALTGYAADEVIGKSVRLLRSGEQSKAFYADLWKTIVAGRLWRGELVNRKKDGSHYVEDMTIAPLPDEQGRAAHFVAVKLDISERKRAEAELRESEERYRLLVDHLEDLVFTTDTAGRFTFVNRAIAGYGFTPEQVLGRPLAAFVHADDQAGLPELFTADAPSHPRELRMIDAYKKVRPVRVRVRPLLVGDEWVGATGVAIDQTARRETEEQLRAAQKMEAVGRLAGGVAHDFNNLLTVILSYAELVAAELEQDPRLQADLEQVLAAAHRAESLTRQLLAFSRRQLLSPEAVDLGGLISGLAKMLERLIGEDIALRIEVQGALPPIKVDRGEIEQVVMNLVVNARDAMPEGGRVTIGLRPIALDVARADALALPPGGYVELEVRDTGTGMAPEVQGRIFEPFFTTKGVGKGTGLGLAMVFGIVRQSGGAIEVESAPGRGSVFRVLLPTQAGCEEPAPKETTARTRKAASECVLVVEDESALLSVIARVLRREGYEVLDCPGASEALGLAQQHGQRVRLILSDVVMPVMNGRELVERLRPLCPRASVVFMSGYTDDAIERIGALDADFIRKPFDVGQLAERLREVLDNQPANAAPN